jgi:rhamnosyl/mannosyltransferase
LHNIELTLVGGGGHLRGYRLFAAHLGGSNIKFVGRLDDDELYALYDRSDVIVLPSITRAEAFGLAVLEGMAAGCVPVVSDLPGVRDLVSRAGVVVPARDVGALRSALLGLADDPMRLEYLSRAARRRAKGLGWDACVIRYEEALLEAVAAAAAGRSFPVLARGDERSGPPWPSPVTALPQDRTVQAMRAGGNGRGPLFGVPAAGAPRQRVSAAANGRVAAAANGQVRR